MKNYLLLLVASATITFSTLITVSHIRAVPCNSGAQVCSYTISSGLIFGSVCLNGVQSTSIMAIENDTRDFAETGGACGMVWSTLFGVPYEITAETCGTGVTPDCQ